MVDRTLTLPCDGIVIDLERVLKPAIDKTESLGKLVKLCPDLFELEARFITKLPSHSYCSSDITEYYFHQLLQFVKRHPHQYKPDDDKFSDSHDLFFADNVRLRKEKHVDPKTHKEKEKWTWLKKEILFNEDFYVDGRPLAIRFSLKSEQPCVAPATGSAVGVEWIRVKKRATYMIDMLCIVFTVTWQGKDEQAVKTCKRMYEVEVEVDNKKLASTAMGRGIVADLWTRMMELQGLLAPVSVTAMS